MNFLMPLNQTNDTQGSFILPPTSQLGLLQFHDENYITVLSASTPPPLLPLRSLCVIQKLVDMCVYAAFCLNYSLPESDSCNHDLKTNNDRSNKDGVNLSFFFSECRLQWEGASCSDA